MKRNLSYLMAVTVLLTAGFTACTPEISILPMGVSLDVSSLTLAPGESLRITAEVMPDESAIKTLTWESDHPDVATVTDGVVTAIDEGQTVIRVTTKSGKKSASCSVTVVYPVSGVAINQHSLLLETGQSRMLSVTVLPDDAPDKSLIWESSNTDVVEVHNGFITAKNPGTATITVITEVGRRMATCSVRVLTERYIMTTTTASDRFELSVSGSGAVEIDWGDGSEIETHMLSVYPFTYYHRYSGMPPFLIAIEGDGITHLTSKSCQLTELTVKIPGLLSLNCSNNQLTGLDISSNTALTSLNCSNNQLAGLDVSNNTALASLNCSNNQLTGLDAGANILLTSLECEKNRLSAESLNDLFESLHGNSVTEAKSICLMDNPGAKTCDRNIAMSKGWKFIEGTISMSMMNAGWAYFSLSGSGTVVIDWGDGSKDEEHTLERLPSSYSHYYSGMIPCTIMISGKDITGLYCSTMNLTELDVSECFTLESLLCSDNQLSYLDVSANTALTDLGCSDNYLQSLDVSANTILQRLECFGNQLSILDVSANTILQSLNCFGNQLASLDVSANTILQYLDCFGNQLSILDVSANTILQSLNCFGNQLTSLDVSANTILQYLDCSWNQLTNLDVNINTALTKLLCSDNHLTGLDVSANTALLTLNCYSNQLTSLDMSNQADLVELQCQSNQLSAGALNALFETLHVVHVWNLLFIFNNPGSDTCYRNIATIKGWNVY